MENTVFQWLGYSREHYLSRGFVVSERILCLAIVHAVNTTKREIVHAYRKVRREASEVVCDHITY
jgi:hypothetical protein